MQTVISNIESYHRDIWKREIQNVSKLRTYVTFKNDFVLEQYVLLNLDKQERSKVAQFRCGILPLRVETGRYVGEAPELRICTFCDRQEVENEQHFLLHCDLYRHIRSNVFQGTDNSISDERKLINITNLYPRKLAKYLVCAFQKRRDIITNQSK